jgi:hypothetical protein
LSKFFQPGPVGRESVLQTHLPRRTTQRSSLQRRRRGGAQEGSTGDSLSEPQAIFSKPGACVGRWCAWSLGGISVQTAPVSTRPGRPCPLLASCQLTRFARPTGCRRQSFFTSLRFCHPVEIQFSG